MSETPDGGFADRVLAPLRELLSERNERVVEAITEANLSALDADLLGPEEREQIGRALEALDTRPGKPSAHAWAMWCRRWYSEANGERRS